MDNKQRIELIRAGNELFNNGNIEKATEIFIKTGYRDGLTRVADYHFYDRKQPLVALKFYQMVKSENMVNQIYDRMFFALGKLLGKNQEQKVELPPLKISPKLKILAEEILQREKESKFSEEKL